MFNGYVNSPKFIDDILSEVLEKSETVTKTIPDAFSEIQRIVGVNKPVITNIKGKYKDSAGVFDFYGTAICNFLYIAPLNSYMCQLTLPYSMGEKRVEIKNDGTVTAYR